MQWVDYILIMIYTGMRIGELVGLKKENIDLLQGFINGGNKTEKGKHRQIPIHKDIYRIIEKLYKESPTDYLLYNKKWIFKKKEKENKPLRINFFREHFYKTLEMLGMNHCATRLQKNIKYPYEQTATYNNGYYRYIGTRKY